MTTIVFTSDRDGDQDIFVIDVDRRDEIRLTDDPGVDHVPFWAPDGSKIRSGAGVTWRAAGERSM
jgi:Tol biopolymer transport system component